MRVLIDIGHPAHVHYFKHFTWKMEELGHHVAFIARDKEVTFDLLDSYEFKYTSRGSGGQGLVGKVLYLLQGGWLVYRAARKNKTDLILSFASSYAAHASFALGLPHIALDDTEHSKLELLLYPPFTKRILTPYYFKKDLGRKQVRFKAFIEQLYLSKNYFKPNQQVLHHLFPGEQELTDYCIVRFVSWSASHDAGVSRLSVRDKIEIVESLSKKYRVFISSEGEMPDVLKKYQITIPSIQMHDALFYAKLYVGEGATTASESVMLCTPAVYTNSLRMGYIEEEERAGLLICSTEKEKIMNAIDAFTALTNEEINERQTLLLTETIDPTAFLLNYIQSKSYLL